MPRSARIVLPGVAHHVTQRGNNKQDVFLDEEDRSKYLDLLRHYSELFDLRIIAYCLMSNHLHLVVVPMNEESLAETLGRTHQQYTEHFHTRYARSGHLWQSRFYSCPMDVEHAVNAIAYVELNPVRAKMVDTAWNYPWSSASAHLGQRGDRLLDLSRWFGQFSVERWFEMLSISEKDTAMAETVRRHTQKGRPLGREKNFLQQVDWWKGRQ